MQANKTSLKQKLIAIVAAIVFSITSFSVFAFAPSTTAKALAIDEAPFTVEEVSVSNNDFSDGNGDGLREPTGWTGETLGGALEGSTVNGVIDLDPNVLNTSERLEEYKLNIYDEFKTSVPRTPFGKEDSDKFPSTSSDALLINSNETETAYGYTSSSISLNANAYYKIGVWVKTGSFAASGGASVKVAGMKNPLVFSNIDTVSYFDEENKNEDESRNFGWVEYVFYIETSSMSSSSVTVSLALGNHTEYTDANGGTHEVNETAKGYVFFDHIRAYQYAPDAFYRELEGRNLTETEYGFPFSAADNDKYRLNEKRNVMFYSENDAEYLSIADGQLLHEGDANYEANELGSFDNGTNGWTILPGTQSTHTMVTGVFDGPSEDLGFEDMIPYSPDGNRNSIAVLSNYRTEAERFDNSTMGYGTEYFTVPQEKNYRLSVWVNAVGGSVASAAVSGYDYRGVIDDPQSPNDGQPQLRVNADLSAGDTANTSRNGWREIVFFLKGSAFTDYRVRLELWLGQLTFASSGNTYNNVSGVAMFDNVRIEEVTAEELNNYGSSTRNVVFDYESESNSIANAEFDKTESGNEAGVLPAPQNWTLMTAGEDQTTGMATDIVNEKYRNTSVVGVVNSNATTYNYKVPNSGRYLTGSLDTGKRATDGYSKLLLIKSDASTGNADGAAIGYRSSSFSIASNTVQRVDVQLRVSDIDGYGANLVLKNSTNILATIEKIQASNDYKTYSFYVDSGANGLSEAYIEIWLGLYDRVNNRTKLSSGTILVESAKLTNLSEGEAEDAATAAKTEFDERSEAYESQMSIGSAPEFAVYSATDDRFRAYDRYTNDYIKTPYNWQLGDVMSGNGNDAVTFGFFDGTQPNAAYLPSGYEHKGADNDMSLILTNRSPAVSRVTSRSSFTLDGGSYYTVTVKAKVDIPSAQAEIRPDFKGATIGIAETEFACSDIKSTATVTDLFAPDSDDNQSYKEFKIFIHTSGSAPSTDDSDSDSSSTDTTTVRLEFGLGGTGSTDEWAIGSLMINSVKLEQVTNAEFEEAQEKIASGGAIVGKYNVIADYAADDKNPEDTDEPTDEEAPNGENWYIYISIILAVVVLIAIVAVAVRYFAKKKKSEGVKDTAPSYDREKTLVKQYNSRIENAESIEDVLDGYEMFDEDEEEKFLEAKELAALTGAADEAKTEPEATEESPAEAVTETPAEEKTEETESAETTKTSDTEEAANESPAEGSTEASAETEAQTEEDSEYRYSEEIVDFTPSEERKKELEMKKAEAARKKAEKEAEAKRAEEERAKIEAARREATRRYNNWDDFED